MTPSNSSVLRLAGIKPAPIPIMVGVVVVVVVIIVIVVVGVVGVVVGGGGGHDQFDSVASHERAISVCQY